MSSLSKPPHQATVPANSQATPRIALERVSKTYRPKKGVPVDALKDVSLTIRSGEFISLAGPSGSGKSTLLNIMGGLDDATSGTVRVDGSDMGSMSRAERANFRLEHLGFIFQSYNLIPVLTAFENAEFMLLLQGVSIDERKRRVTEELTELGIEPHEFHRRPDMLSGGQQQRVAIARALVARPGIILADEPTANLDSVTGSRLLDNMRRLNEQTGVTFVFSTHDPMVIERARRRIHMRDGAIVSDTEVVDTTPTKSTAV